MKIALIKPSQTYADWYRRPLLGISYISAYLESKGIESNIFDAYFNSWSEQKLVSHVANYRPGIIGITAMTHEIVQASRIASKLKELLNVPVIIGGCHVTALPERTLEEFSVFDYGVYGEGEKTTYELLQHLEQGKDVSDIRGLAFRDSNGYIHINEPRPFLTTSELDELPYPTFYYYYTGRKPLAGKNLYYTMFTSRGCPYRCAFCMQVLGKKVRRRSTENIISEMEYAISSYGAHTFDFADEIFLFPGKQTYKLLQMMIERNLPRRIRWKGLTRADAVTPELINLAKKAGCYRLEMGVESGDNQILKAIGKGITVEQVKDAVSIIKKAGISLGTYFILGHPNETIETLRKTVNLAVKLNTDTIALGIMVPYPGTKIYEMARQGKGGYRLLTEDWSQYDKYGGRALELNGLSFRELRRWQTQALIYFYLKNLRLLDFAKYIYQRRKGIITLLRGRFPGVNVIGH